MRKGNIFAICAVVCIVVISSAIAISTGFFTDRTPKNSFTLKAANLDNELEVNMDKWYINPYNSEIATITFTATNNSNIEIANQINLYSTFTRENNGIYEDDINALSFYPDTLSDKEIYDDIYDGEKSYPKNVVYNSSIDKDCGYSSVDLPDLMVPAGETATFTVKAIFRPNYLSDYAIYDNVAYNTALINVSAVAKTKNESGGYGFSESLGNNDLYLYMSQQMDQMFEVNDISVMYGKTYTYDDPIINLYDYINLRQYYDWYDDIPVKISDAIPYNYGLSIKDGRIYGTLNTTEIDYDNCIDIEGSSWDGQIDFHLLSKKRDINDIINTFTVSNQVYTGSAITPSPTLVNSDTKETLIKDTDYELSYSNNTNVGNATITITGKGNYSGTIEKTFTIAARVISSVTISTISEQTYTGSAFIPKPTLKYNGKTLIENTDYTLSYSDNTDVGTATITITGKGNFTSTTTKTFTISARNISEATIDNVVAQTYTGDEITPIPTIAYNGKTLLKDTDYTLSYSNNKAVGSGVITITGKGNFSGTTSKSFTINARAISSATIGSVSAQTYTGSAITPTPTLTYNSKTLTKDTDYTLSYSNNVNVGTATITITGKGNFSGTTTKTFTISARAISSATIGTVANQTYTGNAFTPTPTLTYNSKTLTKDTDYTLSYSNNVNAGTATITITGKGNFSGTTTKTFTISARAISSATVGTVSSYTYTGSAITPTPTITYNGKTLVKGTDYTLSYSNNINAEDDSLITITGKGNFTGTTTKTFLIERCNVSNFTVSSISNEIFCGYGIKPEPTVTYNGKTLKAWQDYELIYKNNIYVGTATVVIDGTYSANFTGQKEVTFTIEPFDISDDSGDNYVTASVTNKTYTGSTLSPDEDVEFNYLLDGYDFKVHTLTRGTDYTISCPDYINAGTKTVTITGKGDFKGSITRSWSITKASQSAPTSLSYTANSLSQVTLTASGSGKTSLQYSKDGTNWQSSNVFTGLSSETVYTFYARYASSTNYNASSSKTVQGICSNYTWNAPSTGTIGTTVTGLSSLGSSLTTINIPSRATAINASAFSGKTQLTKISSLGTNVTSIGEKAFYNCKNITGSLTIPSKVTSIGNYAFYYCSGLTGSLTIPNTVTSLGTYAFRYCSGFTGTLTIGTGLTSISNYAFANCTGFTGSLTIPNNVTSIGTYAFFYDSGFDGDLTLSNKLTSIGTYAFSNCTNVTGNFSIADTVTSIGTYAFRNCESITGVTMGTGITTIPSACFRYCSSLVDVNIGTNVTTINAAAFGGCIAVKYINLPSKVTTIDDSAFEACTNLKYLGIPASITTIGSNVVSLDDNLTVYIDKSEGTISSLDANWDSLFNGTVIYRNYYTWSGTSITGLASGHTTLSSIYIPNTCTGISSSAFKGKTSITSVYFADGCTSLGTYAFQSCSKLADIRLPKTLTTISNYAFRYCSALTSIEIPSSVTSIGSSYVFGSCSKLKYVYIDKNRNSLSGSPWSASTSTTTFVYRNDYSWSSDNTTITGLSYTSLTKLYIPASVGDSAFKDNDNITNLKFSENVRTIGEMAFWSCGKVANDLVIPYGISHIGPLGFMGLGISSLTIEDGALRDVGDRVFYSCFAMSSITLSDTLKSINKEGFGAFWLTGLTTVNFGSSIEYIGDSAFSSSNLTSVTIPSSVTFIDSYAFLSCNNLESITINKSTDSISGSPWGAENATITWATSTNSLLLSEVEEDFDKINDIVIESIDDIELENTDEPSSESSENEAGEGEQTQEVVTDTVVPLPLATPDMTDDLETNVPIEDALSTNNPTLVTQEITP